MRLLYLETQVYHRSLNSAFVTGYTMEKAKLVRPTIFINMMKSLLPEADLKFYAKYKKIVSPKFLGAKKGLARLINARGKKELTGEGKLPEGLDPVIADSLLYILPCFFFWMVAGFFFCVFLKQEGMWWSFEIGRFLFPITAFFASLFVIRKSLRTGYDKHKQEEGST